MASGVEVRRAAPEDADALSRIAFAAKGHWGYPGGWMERWRDGLTVAPDFVHRNEVWAAVADDVPAGFYALVGEGRVLGLEHLWVSPARIGTGVGRFLFDHAVRRAAALGAEALSIEADPNAEGFYLRMGARRVGEEVYDLDGERRTLPLLTVDVPAHEPQRGPSHPQTRPPL